MDVDSLISPVLPDYLDLVNEIIGLDASFFIGGVIASFIAWAIGYAIYTAFHWLNNWAS